MDFSCESFHFDQRVLKVPNAHNTKSKKHKSALYIISQPAFHIRFHVVPTTTRGSGDYILFNYERNEGVERLSNLFSITQQFRKSSSQARSSDTTPLLQLQRKASSVT